MRADHASSRGKFGTLGKELSRYGRARVSWLQLPGSPAGVIQNVAVTNR
jgi:hypothetical protein